jgi:hypothetical protein
VPYIKLDDDLGVVVEHVSSLLLPHVRLEGFETWCRHVQRASAGVDSSSATSPQFCAYAACSLPVAVIVACGHHCCHRGLKLTLLLLLLPPTSLQ